jgi:hypothetical protein
VSWSEKFQNGSVVGIRRPSQKIETTINKYQTTSANEIKSIPVSTPASCREIPGEKFRPSALIKCRPDAKRQAARQVESERL